MAVLRESGRFQQLTRFLWIRLGSPGIFGGMYPGSPSLSSSSSSTASCIVSSNSGAGPSTSPILSRLCSSSHRVSGPGVLNASRPGREGVEPPLVEEPDVLELRDWRERRRARVADGSGVGAGSSAAARCVCRSGAGVRMFWNVRVDAGGGARAGVLNGANVCDLDGWIDGLTVDVNRRLGSVMFSYFLDWARTQCWPGRHKRKLAAHQGPFPLSLCLYHPFRRLQLHRHP